MNNILDINIIEKKILKSISVGFISLFCLWTLLYTFTEHSTIIIISILSVFYILLFLLVKFYIKNLTSNISEIYANKLKYEKFSKDYLNALEDTSPNLLISFLENKISKVNKAFLDFTGFKDIESFKKSHKSISELFIVRTGYLSNFLGTKNWLEYILDKPYHLQKVILRKDNEEYIFLVNARELNIDDKSRVICTFIDITEFEKLQTQFELAINATQDGLWDWDLKTNNVYFSPRWKKQLGYEDDELENILNTWTKLVHPDDLEQAQFDIQQNIDGKTILYENKHRLKHKNGSWIWILDRGQTIYDENNKPIRMIGFHTDITEKMIIEQELHDKDEMMIAQSQNAAMGEMISMIAHQWRQPLSVISMAANNIMADIELESIEYKSLKDTALEITKQTNELSNTIDDFRDFFRPKKSKEIVSVHKVFDDAFNIINQSLENNNVFVIKDFQSEKEIETYSRELMQVILNILKNSKEILCEKEIINKEITIRTYDYEDNVVIEISDNAGGIPKRFIPKIFDPYFSTKNDKTGTGLGLYMCKVIVEKHLNGRINATNKENGACFTIIINDKKDGYNGK